VNTLCSHPGVRAVLKSGNVEAKYLDIIVVSPRRAGEVYGASPYRHWQESSRTCSKAAKILRPRSQQVKGVKDVNLSGRAQMPADVHLSRKVTAALREEK